MTIDFFKTPILCSNKGNQHLIYIYIYVCVCVWVNYNDLTVLPH